MFAHPSSARAPATALLASIALVACGQLEYDARVVLGVSVPRAEADAEAYIESRVAMVTSEPVLGAVVEMLDLTGRWGSADADAAVAKLAPMITAQRLEARAEIEIVAAGFHDAREAADVANAVGRAFAAAANTEARLEAESAIAALSEQIAAQEEKLEASRKAMEAALVAQGGEGDVPQDLGGEGLGEESDGELRAILAARRVEAEEAKRKMFEIMEETTMGKAAMADNLLYLRMMCWDEDLAQHRSNVASLRNVLDQLDGDAMESSPRAGAESTVRGIRFIPSRTGEKFVAAFELQEELTEQRDSRGAGAGDLESRYAALKEELIELTSASQRKELRAVTDQILRDAEAGVIGSQDIAAWERLCDFRTRYRSTKLEFERAREREEAVRIELDRRHK